MKLNLNKEELLKVQKLIDVKELNICAAEFYIDYLNNYYDRLSHQKIIDVKDFAKQMLKAMNVDLNDLEFKALNNNSNILNVTKLNKDEFLQDEYALAIKGITANTKNWKLLTYNYLPFEGFVFDEIIVDETFYKEATPLGYFDEPFPYFAVIQDDYIWMSIIPHEIRTMKQPINDAHGDVLVLGLGLGYYAFHVALKADVKSVTIIEKDEQIIRLFNEHIFPKFKNNNKVKVIHADALEYLSTSNNTKYDFVFVDIYHNVGDGLPLYLKIKAKEKYHPESTFSYWIETSLLAMLRRQTLLVVEELLAGSSAKDRKSVV